MRGTLTGVLLLLMAALHAQAQLSFATNNGALTITGYSGSEGPVVAETPFFSTIATIYYLPDTTGWATPFGGRPAVLWNPSINLVGPGLGVQGGRFVLSISGNTNIPIALESTGGLPYPGWTTLLSGKLTNGMISFADAFQSSGSRFYRISSP